MIQERDEHIAHDLEHNQVGQKVIKERKHILNDLVLKKNKTVQGICVMNISKDKDSFEALTK